MPIPTLDLAADDAREALRRLLPFLALGATVTRTPIDDHFVAWLRANVEHDAAWKSFASLIGMK